LEKEEWLYRAIMGRTIVFSSDIVSKFTTLTYGLDVSKAILKIIGNSKSYGEAYHITSCESVTWQQVLDIYVNVLEKYLNKKPKVLFQNLEDFESWKPAKYQICYDRLFDRKFNNSKIEEYYEFSLSIEEGLSTTIAKFFQDPKFEGINWKAEAIKDRYCKESAALKEIKEIKQKVKYLVFRYIIN
jgi:hypothetical protein